MLFKNKKTGTVIDVHGKISGDDWELVKADKAKKPDKTEKAEKPDKTEKAEKPDNSEEKAGK